MGIQEDIIKLKSMGYEKIRIFNSNYGELHCFVKRNKLKEIKSIKEYEYAADYILGCYEQIGPQWFKYRNEIPKLTETEKILYG